MDEIGDLKATIENLLATAKMHAEGMQHMTNALVAFDQRLREMEKQTRKSSGSAPKLVRAMALPMLPRAS